MATPVMLTTRDWLREIEANVLDAKALDRLALEIRTADLDPVEAADLQDRILRYRGQLEPQALEEALARRFPMSWATFSEGQRTQALMTWDALPLEEVLKDRWFKATDSEGFTRLAKIAMGEGDIVLGEAILMGRTYRPLDD